MAQRADYISRRLSAEPKRWVETPETPQYTSENHALYIGKMLRQSIGQRVASLFGWDSQEKRVYNETFVEASLAELFAGLQPGEKGKLVICRVLSELFNGPQNVKAALSIEKEKAVIEGIARKKFNKTAEELEVVSLEDLPAHAPLLQSIREAQNPDSGELNTVKAFGVKELPQEPKTSLEIAQCLYVATQESPGFMEYLRSTITHRLRELSIEKDEKLPVSYYSLTEIAIRISELIHGQNIHIGVARQSIYDDIIHWIIKGDKKPFNTPALKRVASACKNIKFYTVHVRTEKSPAYQKRSTRNRIARWTTKIGIGALITTGVVKTVHDDREQQAKEEHRELNAAIIEEMKGKSCSFEGDHIRVKIDLGKLEYMTEKAGKQIEHGYKIAQSKQEELKISAMFKQFLLNHQREFLTVQCVDAFKIMEATHILMEENKFFFKANGIDIDAPYQNFQPYHQALLELAEKDRIWDDDPENIVENEKVCPQGGEPFCVATPGLHEIGLVQGEGLTYKLFITKVQGQQEIVGRFVEESKDIGSLNQSISTSMAQSAAQDFVRNMELYDIRQLVKQEGWHDLLWGLAEENHRESVPETMEDKEKVYPFILEHEVPYIDSFGRFEYYFVKGAYRDPQTGEWKRCLKARTSEEKEYSIQRAREGAKWYLTAKYPHLKR